MVQASTVAVKVTDCCSGGGYFQKGANMQKQFIEVLFWSKGSGHIQIRIYDNDTIFENGWKMLQWNSAPEGWFMPTSEAWFLEVPHD